MPLIKGNLLLRKFEERLGQATHADIAAAWVGPCDAIEALRKSAAGTKIRIAVGLSGNSTTPSTLRSLQEFAELRIGQSPPNGIFHPKFYLFRGPEKKICWVGSANLTRKGFGGNAELIHEFDDEDGEGRKWFKHLWSGLERCPNQAIANYEQRYTPPQYAQRPYEGPKPERPELPDPTTWDDFVLGLRERDEYCRSHKDIGGIDGDVIGETHSYIHTITTGRDVVRRNDWETLTPRECDILRGRNTDEGVWAFLGTMRAKATTVFSPQNAAGVREVRNRVREQVGRVLNVGDDEIAGVAQDAMRKICHEQGFGPAAASRLLTLARPDRLVSVNGASADRLGKFSGLKPEAPALAKKYDALLDWLYERPWFKEQQPDDPSKLEIWNCRAALLDAFVYDKLNG